MAGIRFGSEIAAQLIYERLSASPVVTGVVGSRLIGMSVVPASEAMPAGLFYPYSSGYDGPISGEASSETLGITVRFVCEDTSTEPIADAAEAQYDIFAGKDFDITVNGTAYHVDFSEEGEHIPTTEYESGTYRRSLGTRYRVNVTRG